MASQLQAEKLKQQKFLTSRLDIEDRARHGVYIDTNGSVGALNRLGSEMLSMFEGVLHDFASDHAAKFKISYRESLVLHRERFRKLREQMAAVQRAAAAQKPKTIEPEE